MSHTRIFSWHKRGIVGIKIDGIIRGNAASLDRLHGLRNSVTRAGDLVALLDDVGGISASRCHPDGDRGRLADVRFPDLTGWFIEPAPSWVARGEEDTWRLRRYHVAIVEYEAVSA
ncbi:hypothetical protein [Streptomyces sp. NBC_01236]|uniref:hypothetical protein n=1 Tax=Streptomyces sp. NBC_01236 TaxID=2903789 RepID=UPI002E1334EB|nr:hypothetical protein OG324_04225 [Streptomyces sp. NBC_01236]